MTTVPGVADGQLIATSWGNTVATVVNGEVVRKDGSTMTGMLVLPGTNPTGANQATRKGYVDAAIANAVTGYVSRSGDTMTGALILPSANPTGGREAAHRSFVVEQCGLRVAISGDTMTGALNMNGHTVSGLRDPTSAQEAATKAYADSKVDKGGATMSGDLNMNDNRVVGIADPTAPQNAANQRWCNNTFAPKPALDALVARIDALEAEMAALRQAG
jgi:hypothetical protein